MNYCVLVNISKTTISFWYQLENAPYETLSQKEGNELPLYFYANGNEFILGSIAREKYLNGDHTNAFGNYFDIITNPSNFFNVYGNQKHVKFLMYYAIEQYLSHFISTFLYKNESIEGYRNGFPLRFTFSNDIAQKEKLLIEGIFKESGYDNIDSISYSDFLLNLLCKNGIVNSQLPLILLTGIDGNLFIELFYKSFINSISHSIVEDQGSDPRIKIMAKMIYDDAMASVRLSLDEKKEIFHLLSSAKAFLDQESAIPKGDITLSDGTNCWVKLKRKDLDERLLYYNGEEKINKEIDKLLLENGIQPNAIQFLLNGDAVNTQYFIDRLKKKYTNVFGVPFQAQNEVLKLIFKSISSSGYKVISSVETKTFQPIKNDTSANMPLDSKMALRSNEPLVVHTPPRVNTPPVAPSIPRSNVPPVVHTPPRVSTPPVAPSIPRSNVPPVVHTPPRVSAPPVAPSIPRSNVPPVVHTPPRVNTPPVPPSVPRASVPPVLHTPPKINTPPVINTPKPSQKQSNLKTPPPLPTKK